MGRSMEKESSLLFSEKEIEDLLVKGLVSQYLGDEHLDLLTSLRDRARRVLASLSERQLRLVAGEKICCPEASLVDLVREALTLEEEEELVPRRKDDAAGRTRNMQDYRARKRTLGLCVEGGCWRPVEGTSRCAEHAAKRRGKKSQK